MGDDGMRPPPRKGVGFLSLPSTSSKRSATAGWPPFTGRTIRALVATSRSRSSIRTCATRSRRSTVLRRGEGGREAPPPEHRRSVRRLARKGSPSSTSSSSCPRHNAAQVLLERGASRPRSPRPRRRAPRGPRPRACRRRHPPRHQARERHDTSTTPRPRAIIERPRRQGASRAAQGVTIVKLTDFGIAKLLDARASPRPVRSSAAPPTWRPSKSKGGGRRAGRRLRTGRPPLRVHGGAPPVRRGRIRPRCCVECSRGRYPEAQRERLVVGAQWSALLDSAARARRAGSVRRRDHDACGDDCGARPTRRSFPGARARGLARRAERVRASARQADNRWLCTLGNEARKRRDVLRAATDYSRALAHAPDNRTAYPHRRNDEPRGSACPIRPAGGGCARLDGRPRGGRVRDGPSGAHARRSHLRARPEGCHCRRTAAHRSTHRRSLPRVERTSRVERLFSAACRSTSSASRIIERTERTITLNLTPPMGVRLSIDGAAPIDESTLATLRLDTKPHTLVFDCQVCRAVQVALGAGDKDERLEVNVRSSPRHCKSRATPTRPTKISKTPSSSSGWAKTASL